MLYLTPSTAATMNFYTLKRFRKGNFLFASLFTVSPFTTHVLEGVVLDYMGLADKPSDFIIPSLAGKFLNSPDVRAAYLNLVEAGLIQLGGGITKDNIDGLALNEIPVRVLPLYFVLFDICSCIDTSSYTIEDAIAILRDIIFDDLPCNINSVEEAVYPFREFLESPYISPKSRKIAQSLLDILPSAKEEKDVVEG